MGGLPFLDYLRTFSSDLIFDTQQHAVLSLYVVAIAATIGLLLAMATYRNRAAASIVIGFSSVAFTLPSIALFGLLVPVFGLGLATVFPVLVLYAILPVLRNSVVGLQSVDVSTLDAARGMGMGRMRVLLLVELPLAWPVILTGIRVAAQLTIGLVAIAAYVTGPGLGHYLISALANLGSANTFNQALAGTILIAILALVIDLIFVLIKRITTPRGLRV